MAMGYANYFTCKGLAHGKHMRRYEKIGNNRYKFKIASQYCSVAADPVAVLRTCMYLLYCGVVPV